MSSLATASLPIMYFHPTLGSLRDILDSFYQGDLEFGNMQSQTDGMKLPQRALAQVRAYRTQLQNPYACMEELEELAAVEESALHRSGNPWASLSMWDGHEDALATRPNVAPAAITQSHATKRLEPSLSKEKFRRGCTQIFLSYVPRLQARRITSRHRHFIDRNEGRSGHIRHRLLEELGRYDLHRMKDLRPHFNREDLDGLMDQKLRAIEARVLGGK